MFVLAVTPFAANQPIAVIAVVALDGSIPFDGIYSLSVTPVVTVVVTLKVSTAPVSFEV